MPRHPILAAIALLLLVRGAAHAAATPDLTLDVGLLRCVQSTKLAGHSLDAAAGPGRTGPEGRERPEDPHLGLRTLFIL